MRGGSVTDETKGQGNARDSKREAGSIDVRYLLTDSKGNKLEVSRKERAGGVNYGQT